VVEAGYAGYNGSDGGTTAGMRESLRQRNLGQFKEAVGLRQ
jgi:hypothetical protein